MNLKHLFVDKKGFIIENILNKTVLDIGCVESIGDYSIENMKKTLHYQIKKYTKKLVGVDFEEEGVKTLNKLGCECYVEFAENISKFNIGKFDVILLADIIEHIPNPNFFLLSLRDLLNENGIIICTTPNALGVEYHFRLFLSKFSIKHHYVGSRGQHLGWYCHVTLNNLFLLSGYKEKLFKYIVYWKTLRNPIRKVIENIYLYINPEFSSAIFGIYEINSEYTCNNQQMVQKKRNIS